MTVIVDDSHSVWSGHRHNLVAVERYVYFPSSAASLGIGRPSLLEANRCVGDVGMACVATGMHEWMHTWMGFMSTGVLSAACSRYAMQLRPTTGRGLSARPPAPLARRDECAEQGMLMVALGVLLRVHAVVMAALRAPPATLPGGELAFRGWDVRHALAQARGQVLRGVRIVFTRVIPLEQAPHTHPLWRMAESFGARCSTALAPDTTHLVAGASGTDKVLQARAAGTWVVTPAWLECSCTLWKRAHEERFLVPP